MLASLLVGFVFLCNADSLWDPLTDALKAWPFTSNYAIIIGNSSGEVFSYYGGDFTPQTHCTLASSSKWPVAMMFLKLVEEGTIGLRTPVNNYIDWWTKDPKDPRSNVTLEHLLSFTSGFGGGHPGRKGMMKLEKPQFDATKCTERRNYDFVKCGKEIYETVEVMGNPGTVYSYNSYHLRLAGTLGLIVTGLDIQSFLEKYLWTPYEMKNSFCNGTNPDLATCVITVAPDYTNWLYKTLTHAVLPKALVDVSEENHTPFNDDNYQFYGPYGFGHFLECFDNPDGFTDACRMKQVHIDPGAFGYYPMIDRNHGYYFNLATSEGGKEYGLSGIPEYLAQAVKPVVDQIIIGVNVTETIGHHTKIFQSLTMADATYIGGCALKPLSCV